MNQLKAALQILVEEVSEDIRILRRKSQKRRRAIVVIELIPGRRPRKIRIW